MIAEDREGCLRRWDAALLDALKGYRLEAGRLQRSLEDAPKALQFRGEKTE